MPRLGKGIREYTVTVQGRPEKRYLWRWQGVGPDGTYHDESNGHGGFIDYDTCVADRLDFIRSVQEGQAGKKKRAAKLLYSKTLGELILDFLQYRKMQPASKLNVGHQVEDKCLKGFLSREAKGLCSKPMGALETKDWQDYVDRRLRTDRKSSTIRREIVVLKQLMKYGRLQVKLPLENMFSDVVIPSNPPGREPDYDLFYNTQYIDLCRAIYYKSKTKKHRELWFALLEVALATALDRGQLLKLIWKDIDLNKLTILAPMRKTYRIRNLLPVTKETASNLHWYYLHNSGPKSTDRVFPITAWAHEKYWVRICRNAGVDHRTLHFHDLRHIASTSLAKILTMEEVEYMTCHKPKGQVQTRGYVNKDVWMREKFDPIRSKLTAHEAKLEAIRNEAISTLRKDRGITDEVLATFTYIDEAKLKEKGAG